MADYKIELGVKLKDSDIQAQINGIQNGLNPIEIKVNAETKELTNTIKAALKTLTSGTKNALTLDTTSLESSFKDVASTIKDIKTSIGTLDSKSGMKSLLSSINQISTALDKASDQFVELNSQLKSLSGKDFSINFGLNMGGSNNPIGRNVAYGNKVRSETLPQLKEQVSALVKHYNTEYKQSLSEFEVLQKLVSGTKLSTGDFFESFLFGKDSVASRMNSGSLSSQMQAHKEYIDMFKKAANLKGLNLDSVTSGFSKTADQLIQDAQDIQTGANEMENSFEKLKGIFGTSIDTEGLSAALQPIAQDIKQISEFIDGLAKNNSIDGLTKSFNRLADVIDKLEANAKSIQDIFDNLLSGAGNNVARTAQQINQAGKLISDSAKKSIEGVSSKGINKYFKLDKSDSDAFKREMDNLVSQWTSGKGKIVDVKIDTKTSWDKDAQANIERLSKAQVTYNNELNETITKTIAWRKIGFNIDADGKESPLYGFSEVASRYSKTMGETTVQTNNFVKQQKQAVSNLTNQINQMNRAANDKNATKPIKDASHLNVLTSKYNEVVSAIQRMGNASSDTFIDEQNNVKKLISEYKSMVSEFKNAENVSSKMKGFDLKSGIDVATNDLKKLKAEAKGFSMDFSQLDESLKNIGDAASLNSFNDQLRVARSELAKIKAEASASNRSKNLGIDTSGLKNSISSLQRISPEINNFKTKIDGAEVSVESLLRDLADVKTQGDFSVVNKRFNEFTKAAKEAGIAVTEAAAKTKLINEDNFALDKQKALLRLKGLFGENSEAARRFAAELNKIEKELDECSDPSGLRKINKEMDVLVRKANNAELKTQTFGQKFKKQWQQYSSYLSVASVFMYVEQGLRSMFEQVKLIDSAMTELKKVTNETDASYNQFLSNAASRSKELGTTIDGFVSSTADFARLGYDFTDAQGLAEVANIYAVVGDEIDGVEDATQSLISTLTAFKDEMNDMSDSDFALSIVDKMNEVSNNFAISSGGIGEALQRSASSLAAANNTLDESIALITAANTVVNLCHAA